MAEIKLNSEDLSIDTLKRCAQKAGSDGSDATAALHLHAVIRAIEAQIPKSKPDEPTGFGSVVRATSPHGRTFLWQKTPNAGKHYWEAEDGTVEVWSELTDVEVLRVGVGEPTGCGRYGESVEIDLDEVDPEAHDRIHVSTRGGTHPYSRCSVEFCHFQPTPEMLGATPPTEVAEAHEEPSDRERIRRNQVENLIYYYADAMWYEATDPGMTTELWRSSFREFAEKVQALQGDEGVTYLKGVAYGVRSERAEWVKKVRSLAWSVRGYGDSEITAEGVATSLEALLPKTEEATDG